MLVPDRVKESIGEILFKMMSVATREMGQQMRYATWQQLDVNTKANYMSVVEEIVSQIPEPPPAPRGEPSGRAPALVEEIPNQVVSETSGTAGAQPVLNSVTESVDNSNETKRVSVEESAIAKAIIASHPGIRLAPKVPLQNPLACQFCGAVKKTKHGKTMHEKSCLSRPVEVGA